jgi:ElaB/YqjD/DUF883 family membrane-anchored ribosome-binding protein
MNEDRIADGAHAGDGRVIGARADGVLDQVVGGAQTIYGRARVQFRDLAEDAPFRAKQTGDRIRQVARRGARVADDNVRDHPFVLAAIAGVSAYLVAWLVHTRRA